MNRRSGEANASQLTKLEPRQRIHFRDQLRSARACALKDSEAFLGILIAIERLGAFLRSGAIGLGGLKSGLSAVAERAPSVASRCAVRSGLVPFERLFEHVRVQRNEAVHAGAYARHLTRHCVELALLLEEGLMAEAEVVSDFMIRDITFAEAWQPVAFARQQMLLNSFSFLPIELGGQWQFLSDFEVARFVRGAANPKGALELSIEDAHVRYGLKLARAEIVVATSTVKQALHTSRGQPVLVKDESDRIVGLVTPFDLL